eukprot:TRINITY_DN9871_c0_g1_i1.p1 TRINITY_DN9871_c0_g1~~TRINITY_DN9871_c0_g1_i1.p1  ORF type:complete len:1615 (-),score=315.29 TRINITY_DN9871_c0_g1_i1:91-4935(-)
MQTHCRYRSLTDKPCAWFLLADYLVSLLYFAYFHRESDDGTRLVEASGFIVDEPNEDDNLSLFLTACIEQDQSLKGDTFSTADDSDDEVSASASQAGTFTWDWYVLRRVAKIFQVSLTNGSNARSMYDNKALRAAVRKKLDAINNLSVNTNSFLVTETDRMMHELLTASCSHAKRAYGCLHVVKVPTIQIGQKFVQRLIHVCVRTCLKNRFAVLRDFGEFVLSDVDGSYFYSDIINNIRCPDCSCKSFKVDVELLNRVSALTERCITVPKADRLKLRICQTCRHAHNNMKVYEDLCIPALLVLVKKGALGDTFPTTFTSFDLRSLHNSGGAARDSLVQELGRLCHHRDDIKEIFDLPYALVSKTLGNKLREAYSTDSIGNPASSYCAFNMDFLEDQRLRQKLVDHCANGKALTAASKPKKAAYAKSLHDKTDVKELEQVYSDGDVPERLQNQAFRSYDDLIASYSDDKGTWTVTPRVRPRDDGTTLDDDEFASLQAELKAFYNFNIFLLRAHPQVGKTGAFLQTARLLFEEISSRRQIQPGPYRPGKGKVFPREDDYRLKLWGPQYDRPYWKGVQHGWIKFQKNPEYAIQHMKGGKYLFIRARKRLELMLASPPDAEIVQLLSTAEGLVAYEQKALRSVVQDRTVETYLTACAFGCAIFNREEWSQLRDVLLFDHVLEEDRRKVRTYEMFLQALSLEQCDGHAAMADGDCHKLNEVVSKPPGSKASGYVVRSSITTEERDNCDELVALPPVSHAIDERAVQQLFIAKKESWPADSEDFTVSLYTSSQRLRPLFGDEALVHGLKERTVKNASKYWLFSPSHRGIDSRLNWPPSAGKASPIMVVVVEQSLFLNYCRLYGATHIVMGLPQLQVTIGMKRRLIQLIASHLELDCIHLWDDNVERAYRTTLITNPDDAGVEMSERGIAMQDIIHELEQFDDTARQFPSTDDLQLQAASSGSWGTFKGAGEPTTWPEFTTAAANYAVIGVNKNGEFNKLGFPFCFTMSACSVILLNVKATVAKGVFFPPVATKEDLRFNLACIHAGLAVVKDKQLRIQKTPNRLQSTPVFEEPPSSSQLVTLTGDMSLAPKDHVLKVDDKFQKAALRVWADSWSDTYQLSRVYPIPNKPASNDPWRHVKTCLTDSAIRVVTAEDITEEKARSDSVQKALLQPPFSVTTMYLLVQAFAPNANTVADLLNAVHAKTGYTATLAIAFSPSEKGVPFKVASGRKGAEHTLVVLCLGAGQIVYPARSTVATPTLSVIAPASSASIVSVPPPSPKKPAAEESVRKPVVKKRAKKEDAKPKRKKARPDSTEQAIEIPSDDEPLKSRVAKRKHEGATKPEKIAKAASLPADPAQIAALLATLGNVPEDRLEPKSVWRLLGGKSKDLKKTVKVAITAWIDQYAKAHGTAERDVAFGKLKAAVDQWMQNYSFSDLLDNVDLSDWKGAVTRVGELIMDEYFEKGVNWFPLRKIFRTMVRNAMNEKMESGKLARPVKHGIFTVHSIGHRGKRLVDPEKSDLSFPVGYVVERTYPDLNNVTAGDKQPKVPFTLQVNDSDCTITGSGRTFTAPTVREAFDQLWSVYIEARKRLGKESTPLRNTTASAWGLENPRICHLMKRPTF